MDQYGSRAAALLDRKRVFYLAVLTNIFVSATIGISLPLYRSHPSDRRRAVVRCQRCLFCCPSPSIATSGADSLMERHQFIQTGTQIQQGQIPRRPSVWKQEEAHVQQRSSAGEDVRAFCRLLARILLRTLQEQQASSTQEVGAGMRAGQGDVRLRREPTETLARPATTEDLSGREGRHRLPFQLPRQKVEQ